MRFWISLAVLCGTCLGGQGADRYVVKDNSGAQPPFDSWTNAAADIQTAIDVAEASETVWVSNGVYGAGQTYMAGNWNRVAVTKAVVVRSVNGPQVTYIVGHGPVGPDAVRCAYATNGAELAGFTLADGATRERMAIFRPGNLTGAGYGVRGRKRWYRVASFGATRGGGREAGSAAGRRTTA